MSESFSCPVWHEILGFSECAYNGGFIDRTNDPLNYLSTGFNVIEMCQYENTEECVTLTEHVIGAPLLVSEVQHPTGPTLLLPFHQLSNATLLP